MATNGIHSSQQTNTSQIAPNLPRLGHRRRSKSHDGVILSASDRDHATVPRWSPTGSPQRKSSSYMEALPHPRSREQGVLTYFHPEENSAHDGKRPGEYPLSTMSNGDDRSYTGNGPASTFEGFDNTEHFPDPGVREDFYPVESSQGLSHPSSPRTILHSASPPLSDGRLEDGWNVLSTRSGEPDTISEPRQPETQVGGPHSDTEEVSRLVSPTAEQNVLEDVVIEVEGGVPLPSEARPLAQPTDLWPEPLQLTAPKESIESFAKQARRLRKRTDVVLLKRVQWQTEYSKLKDCRRFLHESTMELMSAIEIHPWLETSQSSPKAKKKRKRKKKKTKADATAEAHQPYDERLSSSTKESSDADTTDPSQEAVEDANSGTTATSQPPKIATLYQRYWDDYEALRQQEDIEKAVMEDLSNREFQLKTLLKAIKLNMHSKNFASELRTEMLEERQSSSDASFKTPPEEELHPLIEEYFELQGAIGVFLERLQELDYEHQEGLMKRDFLRDRADELNELEISDEEFNSNYKDQRDRIEQDLRNARNQFAIIDARCKLANLNPEPYRNVQQSPQSMSPAPSGQRVLNRLLKKTKKAAPGQGPSSREIEGWLQDVPDIRTADASLLSPPEMSLLDVAEIPLDAREE